MSAHWSLFPKEIENGMIWGQRARCCESNRLVLISQAVEITVKCLDGLWVFALLNCLGLVDGLELYRMSMKMS